MFLSLCLNPDVANQSNCWPTPELLTHLTNDSHQPSQREEGLIAACTADHRGALGEVLAPQSLLLTRHGSKSERGVGGVEGVVLASGTHLEKGIVGLEVMGWEGLVGGGRVQLWFLLPVRSSSSEPISTCSHRSVCVCRLSYQTHPAAVRGGVEEGGVASANGPRVWLDGGGGHQAGKQALAPDC